MRPLVQIAARWSLAAGSLLVAPAALGQVPPGGTRLVYTRGPGTEGCPDEQALRDVVAAQLGGTDPFLAGDGRRVEVILGRSGREITAEIALYERDGRPLGSQVITNASCGALVEDVGTAFAILLLHPSRPAKDPEPPLPAPSPEAPTPRALAANPQTAPEPVPPCPPAPPVRSAPRPGLSFGWPRFQIGAGVLLADSFAPALAVGFSGLASVRWSSFSLSLEGHAHLPVAAEPYRGRLFGVSSLGGSVVPCGHVAWFFGCALVTAGRVRHFGMVNFVGEAVTPYTGLGVRGGLEVSFSDHVAGQLTSDLVANVMALRLHFPQGAPWSVATTASAASFRLVASF
ncbi:hypothetical protein [Sorangium sp. So ce131]|uniref:hypothetical protein n=1 Tax=Sorangium sp. So ce131 TaxID=3133282 RepID=UPI003F6093C9